MSSLRWQWLHGLHGLNDWDYNVYMEMKRWGCEEMDNLDGIPFDEVECIEWVIT